MWPRPKLKFVARFGYGDALPSDEPLDGTFRVFGSNGPFAFFSRANTRAPAIVIGRKGSYGKINWTAEPCFASDTTFFIDESTSQNHLRWLYWLLQTLRLDEGTDEAAIPGLNRETAYAKDVLVPPLLQQRAIADYLDRKTAQLDALIAEKRRLQELLAEKYRALITRAVTRGLDPNVPLSDSGIPWLGEFPAHWKIGRLKHVGLLIAGSGFPHVFQGVTGNPLPFYKVGDLSLSSNSRHVEKAPNTISYETASELHAHVIPNGSIIYAKIGAALLLNRRRITTVPCCIDNNMTAYVPNNNELTSGWAFYWTQILDFGMLVNPGAVPSISEGDQAELPIAVPPLDEQLTITNHLDLEMAQIDALVGETEQTVSLLRERRYALISAAITGQMEVT